MKNPGMLGFVAGLAAGNLLASWALTDKRHGNRFFRDLRSQCDEMIREMEAKLESLKAKAEEKYDDKPVDMRFTV